MTDESETQAEAGKEPRKQSMLYEACPRCGGKGVLFLDVNEKGQPCFDCKTMNVVETGATAGQLAYIAELDNLRQMAGISAAMLRDGWAKGLLDALRTILRWCDRDGEEPEGQCLHEIEQICRKQLGLEALKP